MRRSAPIWRSGPCLGAVLTAGFLLAGCGGHGQYTTEHKANAEKRMADLKAATDWDLAQQQYQAGDLETALKNVDNSIALSDAIPKSHLLRGRILLEMGRNDEAIKAFDRASELDEKNPEPRYCRGMVLERIGRTDKALAAFREALELKPGHPAYLLATAELLVELDRLKEAEKLLADEESGVQYHPGAKQMLGHIAMIRGDCEAAAEYFAEAAVLGSNEPALLEDLARAQVAAGRFTDADATLQRLLAEQGGSERRDLLHIRARCLIELGRPVEAREILLALTSSEQFANDVDAWARLADVAIMLGDDHMLRSTANRLISIAPDRYEGYLALAVWQRRSGDLPAALRSADRAVERSGTSVAARKLKKSIEKQLTAASAG